MLYSAPNSPVALSEYGNNYEIVASGSSIARWYLVLVLFFATSKGEEMTLRSRFTLGLVTMLVLFVLVPGSFGQVVSVSLSNTPSAQETQTDRTAHTSDPTSPGNGILVTGTLVGSSFGATASVLRISFPAPITASPVSAVGCTVSTGIVATTSGGNGVGTTIASGTTTCVNASGNGTNVPNQDAIRIEGAFGIFASVSLPKLNTSNARIEIALPGGTIDTSAGTTGTFKLLGVRFDANGKTAPVTGTVAVTDASTYALQTSTLTYVNALSDAIGTVAIGALTGSTSQGTATVFTNRTTTHPTGSLVINENYAFGFRTALQESTNLTPENNSTRIRLTFNNLPTGVSLDLTTRNPSGVVATISPTRMTPTVNVALIEFTATNPTLLDQVEVDFTVVNTSGNLSSTAAVTTPGAITVTATLFPIGDGVDNSDPLKLNVPRQDQGYPTFAQKDFGPTTIVNIVPANTTLLVPFAFVGGVFDTGLAISNTTADPFGGTAGGGAVPSSGTITLSLYPTAATGGAGTPITLTTSATVKPGPGLSSDGTLQAGAVWAPLLSQLLAAAAAPAGFSGYIFIQTNFLNAHGTATITDFRTYSLTANVLVVPPPLANGRNNLTHLSLGNGAEMLSY